MSDEVTEAAETIERNETVAAQGTVELLALDLLLLSDLNVRKTERDADIATLAEDIAARGLKQNLVVVPAHFMTSEVDEKYEGEDRWSGKYEVIAGGRRFQALKLLAADGRIPTDHPVPCLIEERESARETSLSENLHKVSMNPADEFEAYAAIVDQLEQQGQDRETAIRACARRFGKTVSHVQGRLRLAGLTPEVLQALREDQITFDAARAYAAISDVKLQLKVFQAQAKSWNKHDPRAIREAMRGKTLPIDDGRVIFVGLDAYRAAGGRTETEMFMGTSGQERVLDVTLLEKLAAEKAEPLVAARAKKDGFREGVLAKGVGYNYKTPKCPPGFKSPDYYASYTPTKAQLKKSIGIYSIAPDGSGIEKRSRFMPKDEKGPSTSGGYQPKTPEEIAAERRARAINRIATRLAVGKFAGSPFEGRAFWPADRNWIEPIEDINEDEVLVAVMVKVAKADIAAQQEAATEKYDAELAEEEAEKLAAAQASADEHGADVADVLDDIDAEQEDEAVE